METTTGWCPFCGEYYDEYTDLHNNKKLIGLGTGQTNELEGVEYRSYAHRQYWKCKKCNRYWNHANEISSSGKYIGKKPS